MADDQTVFVSAEYDMLKDKKFKINLFTAMINRSTYRQDEERRVLRKKDLNFSELSKQTLLGTRQLISRSYDYMKENYPELIVEEGKEIIVYNDYGFTLSIPKKTLSNLTNNFSDNAVKIYLYLFRQHKYWTQIKHAYAYDFTLTNLCEALGYRGDQYSTRQKIKEAMYTLVANGLLTITLVRKGRGVYFRTKAISRYVVLQECFEWKEKELGLDQYLDSKDESGEEEELITFGPLPEKIQKADKVLDSYYLEGKKVKWLEDDDDFQF